MKFVGFPDGLDYSSEKMKCWFAWIRERRPLTNHYSIFNGDEYAGETFYRVDPVHGLASMDIKLFAAARGKGIAARALSFAVEEAFRNGATAAWVEPRPDNRKAIALCRKLGFTEKERPAHLTLEEGDQTVYMEKQKDN